MGLEYLAATRRPVAGRLAGELGGTIRFLPSMKTTVHEQPSFDFYFGPLDTLVRVEEADEQVVIRATRDTFSEQRKAIFIRELAAEGFIPDRYRWFTAVGDASRLGVRWRVDVSWLNLSPELTAATRRFMLRVLGTATVLWFVLMTTLFLRSAG